ncbi:MAG: sialidase family protein, partial [Planctomycetia bacterium]
MRNRCLFGVLMLALASGRAFSQEHVVVFHDRDLFAAWPANGGLWTWDGGQEAVVGFVTGKYRLQAGHNIVPPLVNRLARTVDGGKTWRIEKADGYYQPGDTPTPLADAVPFDDPNLALKFFAEGYHGGAPSPGVLCFSTDRGKSWAGPFALPAFVPAGDPTGRTEFTTRTDYRVQGSDCLVFGSAKTPGKQWSDRVFAGRLVEGGRKVEFLGWVAPVDSPDRAAMPAGVDLGSGRLYVAVRVRNPGADVNWIDGYRSNDGGKVWTKVGRVGQTGAKNGNPPALVVLADGRLLCAYGDRTRGKLFARLSGDDGTTWSDEVSLRDDYA